MIILAAGTGANNQVNAIDFFSTRELDSSEKSTTWHRHLGSDEPQHYGRHVYIARKTELARNL